MRHSPGAPYQNLNGKRVPTADSASPAPRSCQSRAHPMYMGAAAAVGHSEPMSTIGPMCSSGKPNAHELERDTSDFNRARGPGRVLHDHGNVPTTRPLRPKRMVAHA